jgi:hypothetical protein
VVEVEEAAYPFLVQVKHSLLNSLVKYSNYFKEEAEEESMEVLEDSQSELMVPN